MPTTPSRCGVRKAGVPPLAALPEHYGSDSTGEIVISDVFRWNATKDVESLDMAFEKSFLRLGWVYSVNGLA